MTEFIFKLFVKDYDGSDSPQTRRSCGSAVAIIGMVMNIFLAAIKLFAGIVSGAISITADALNNLSDAGSQAVSLISFRISSKPADRDHPFGHARIEYVASMIVSFLVLMVGFELFIESVVKIFRPQDVNYNALIMVILGISIIGKLWLYFFGRAAAKKLKSDCLRATAADSLSDAAATFAVLAAAVITRLTGLRTDAYMGIVVAVVIFIAGIKILNDTKNSILGSAPEPEIIEGIAALAKEYTEILGIHDMVVHNYGPGNTIASFHAEVDGAENVFSTHDAIDNLEKRLYSELGVRATVHMDPIVTDDESISLLREQVLLAVKEIDASFGIHDFRFVKGDSHTNLIFDLTVPFEMKMSDLDIKESVSSSISKLDPNYFTVITIDRE